MMITWCRNSTEQVYQAPCDAGQPGFDVARSDTPTARFRRYPQGMADVQQFSQEAHDRLVAELEDLTTRGRIDLARKIEVARELGDLSENGDYHAAKEEKGKMEGRILHLESLLEKAEIVEQVKTSDVVAPGTVVAVVYDGDDEPERMLVGSIEEQRDDVGVVSPRSPLGEALLGATVGDTVSFEAPSGSLSVRIVAIER